MTGPADYVVMQARKSSLDGLDYFPTPPWATRALLEWLGSNCVGSRSTVAWEPAAGGRHMSLVLAEHFERVIATDVHDYGGLDVVGSFVGEGADVVVSPAGGVDWIITNPPFNLAEGFLDRALGEARQGVALLLRSAWLEGVGRWDRVFRDRPPTDVLQFAERVPMVKGRWDPQASTATSYAWLVWVAAEMQAPVLTQMHWIQPGAAQRCARADDVARFAGERADA